MIQLCEKNCENRFLNVYAQLLMSKEFISLSNHSSKYHITYCQLDSKAYIQILIYSTKISKFLLKIHFPMTVEIQRGGRLESLSCLI